MRTHVLVATVLALSVSSLACAGSGRKERATERSRRPPNVILIAADDLGWGELGCYGQRWIETPSIDRLAAQGTRLTAFYSGSPVCAPSRCTLMTGKNTGHAYVRDNGNPPERGKAHPDQGWFPGQWPIPDQEVTLAEVLRARGYATAGFGKWGLGYEGSSGDPLHQGFDHFGGYLCQIHAHNHYPRFLWLDGEKVVLPGNDRGETGAIHSQDWFVDHALDFVRSHADRRFFLYLPFAVPHLSIQADPDLVAHYVGRIPEADYEHHGYLRHPTPRAGYAAMVTQMDRGIGQLMALLDQLGLADDTIVLFTSDNGPTYDRLGGSDSDFFESAGPFDGRKGSVREGGIRVPLIVRWPGHVPAGAVRDEPGAWWDLLPTLADLTGATAPEDVDGVSLAPVLLGQGTPTPEDLYWEFPSYGGQVAVRSGDWKLVGEHLKGPPEKRTFALYDLASDPGEATDLSAQHPDVLARLRAIARADHVPSKVFPFPALDAPQ